MTTNIQTATVSSSIRFHKSRKPMGIYNIVVNGEDGNYEEFEVEACSDAEAHRKADEVAQSCMLDITFVEVYRIA